MRVDRNPIFNPKPQTLNPELGPLGGRGTHITGVPPPRLGADAIAGLALDVAGQGQLPASTTGLSAGRGVGLVGFRV